MPEAQVGMLEVPQHLNNNLECKKLITLVTSTSCNLNSDILDVLAGRICGGTFVDAIMASIGLCNSNP